MNMLIMGDLITTSGNIQKRELVRDGDASQEADVSQFEGFAALLKDGGDPNSQIQESLHGDESDAEAGKRGSLLPSDEVGLAPSIGSLEKTAMEIVQGIKLSTHSRVKENNEIVSVSVLVDKLPVSPEQHLVPIKRDFQYEGAQETLVLTKPVKRGISKGVSELVTASVQDSLLKERVVNDLSLPTFTLSKVPETQADNTKLFQQAVERLSDRFVGDDKISKNLNTLKVDVAEVKSPIGVNPGEGGAVMTSLSTDVGVRNEARLITNEKIQLPNNNLINRLKEITKEVSEKLELGDKKELRITVRPSHLGEIKLEIQKSIDGVKLSVVTSSDVVSNLLNQHKSEILAEALREYTESSEQFMDGDGDGSKGSGHQDDLRELDDTQADLVEEVVIEQVTVVNEVS